ncbi:MAG TPA: archease [Thermoanaerobaculia bacterium]|jgi:SHS2 domain-containing protein|nr:archease [Thermoanaerobaculia bacterium]
MPWSVVEHTADVGIEVQAATLEALFVDAAAGFCDVITEVARIGGDQEHTFEVEGAALDLLLVTWLEELLFRFETSGVLYPRGDASVEGKGDSWSLRARMRGERFDAERHPLKVQVKAITYHELEVARDEQGWRARVIFDI